MESGTTRIWRQEYLAQDLPSVAGRGLFEKIWAKGLKKYDELEGIGWEWQSLDDCMIKAPLGRESVEKNPTGQGKNGKGSV